jgi:hypothetical protein
VVVFAYCNSVTRVSISFLFFVVAIVVVIFRGGVSSVEEGLHFRFPIGVADRADKFDCTPHFEATAMTMTATVVSTINIETIMKSLSK